jgi:peptidoglycan/xylan/chitin deacetylase (PgdA/CDA1 family)
MLTRGIDKLRRTMRRVKDVFVSRAIVLLYHRVAELPVDPQLLCVSRKNFAEHLGILRRCGRTIHTKALGEMLELGNRREHVIVVTFDDGYADNLYNARPLLERYDVPATVFVTAGYLDATREFWYDDLERLLLQTHALPQLLELEIRGHRHRWKLGPVAEVGDSGYRISPDWNISHKADPSPRHALYRSLADLLQPLPDAERRQALDQIANWAGMERTGRCSHRTLSQEELRRLAEGGLVEIGSHTMSHPVLSAIPVRAQIDEISRSKARLEEVLGQSIMSFAYPFGGRSHYTEQTVAAVREARFEYGCSNFPGIVRPDTDRFQLPRFLIRDWDGDEFARNLRRWMDV